MLIFEPNKKVENFKIKIDKNITVLNHLWCLLLIIHLLYSLLIQVFHQFVTELHEEFVADWYQH